MINAEEFNDNLFFVFEKLLMNKELAEEFAKCKTEDELYNFCLKIKGGYTKEEWKKFSEIVYRLTIDKENDKILLDNNLEEIGGGNMANNIGKKALSGTLAALTAATVLQFGSVNVSAANSSSKPSVSVLRKSSSDKEGLIKRFWVKLGLVAATIFGGLSLCKLIKSRENKVKVPTEEGSKDEMLVQTSEKETDEDSKDKTPSSAVAVPANSEDQASSSDSVTTTGSTAQLTRERRQSDSAVIPKYELLTDSSDEEKTSISEGQPSVQNSDKVEVPAQEQAVQAGSEDKTPSLDSATTTGSTTQLTRERSQSVDGSTLPGGVTPSFLSKNAHGVKNPQYLCYLISIVQQLISDRGMLELILKDDVKNHIIKDSKDNFEIIKEFNAFREMINMALRCRDGYAMTEKDTESLERILIEAKLYNKKREDVEEYLRKILGDLYPEYSPCLVEPLKIADSTDVQELVEHGGKMNVSKARKILEKEKPRFVKNYVRGLKRIGLSDEEIKLFLNKKIDKLSHKEELRSHDSLRMLAEGEIPCEGGFLLSAGNRVYFPINRTSWVGKGPSKIFTPICVPEILKLDDREYRFAGSILHGGDSADRGHYTSLVSDDGNVFYRFDDDRPVEQINKDKALGLSSEWGAVLIYQLI